MSRLILESLVKNNQENMKSESFDFTRSAASIANRKHQNVHNDIDLELPLQPEESSWETKSDSRGNYLEKIYTFHNKDHLLYFLEESVNKADETDHHPVLLIKKHSVKVILTTDTLQDVSCLDLDLSKFLDEIFEDIHFIGNSF